MVLEYNNTKGRVVNANKWVKKYFYARFTSRWSPRDFMKMLHIGAFYTFIIWISENKHWHHRLKNRRYLFLLELWQSLTFCTGQTIQMVSTFQLAKPLMLRVYLLRAKLQLKAHHKNQRGGRVARGEDTPIFLETTLGMSIQSVNENVLSVKHIGRPAQLWHLLRTVVTERDESVPFTLVKIYSCFSLFRIQS